MIFNREWGQTELIFILLFGVLYLAYWVRIFWYAYRLKTSARSAALKFFLRSAALGALVVALLDPSFGEPEKELQAVGKDIFLVVDVSASMDATDVQPSRIQRVKFELNRLIGSFPGDRFGIILFSAGAYLQCPLTFDRHALSIFTESLNTGLLTDQGTALQPALEMALDKQTLAEGRADASKVVVLISDGEDFSTVESRTLRALRRAGIQLFTVGIGTTAGGRIPTGKGYLHDAAGEVVTTALQPENLQRIAASVGGEYFEVNATRNDFPALTQRIQKVAGRRIDQRKSAITSNKYYYFLILALVLISLDVLTTVRTLRL
ncbi:vWA domain-containing protein [Siphonobacter aquaeclarae]|uniref:Ca-activated chloride channel family protein n=1 Tax=Siphonobacter aquaeclarae TaxID=563176 RepID=A0A1G9KA52_9BACT|nr:VWA domain-containing protein [Siphonobacter aquaeclarae]SDL46512.1 Ca-activated chloride channel family protein [Siphonobacter aquaeclarae]